MKLLVGIDSDGTIFDTMNLKHNEVFWHKMIEIWNITENNDYILSTAKKINLFSLDRGINRFQGLLKLMELTPQLSYLDKSSLYNFINSSFPLSNDGLKKYMEQNGKDKLLEQVLFWSNSIDEDFAKKAENIPPFKWADTSIKKTSQNADVVIVSSASQHLLKRDLCKYGLSNYIKKIMGQESGKKEQQLNSVISEFLPDKTIMIGDAVSDYTAAKAVNALFYPILPGREEESWQLFSDKYYELFINDSYTEEIERELYNQFISVLE